MTQNVKQKQCPFCKTNIDEDAIVCPNCSATHLYYQFEKDDNGETYEEAIKSRKSLDRFYQLTPKVLLGLLFFVAVTWVVSGFGTKGDLSFLIWFLGFMALLVFLIGALIWIPAVIKKRHLYEEPKLIWKRKI